MAQGNSTATAFAYLHAIARPVMNEEEIARQAQDHNQRLELEIAGALNGRDPQQREAAFTFLLPELVQVDPQRVVAMVASLQPGETRDMLNPR